MSKQFSVWFIWFGPPHTERDTHTHTINNRTNDQIGQQTNKQATKIVPTNAVKHTENIQHTDYNVECVEPMQMCDNTQ